MSSFAEVLKKKNAELMAAIQHEYRILFGHPAPPPPAGLNAPYSDEGIAAPGLHFVTRNGLWVDKKVAHEDYSSYYLPFGLASMLGYGYEREPVQVREESSDQEFIGWRVWRVREEPAVLWSVAMDTLWETAAYRADKVPRADTNHGIHACKTRETAREMVYARPWPPVYGEIAMSGTVVEGDWGFRAEQAVIRSLYVVRGTDHLSPMALADALGETYDLDVQLDLTPDRMPTPLPDYDDEDD